MFAFKRDLRRTRQDTLHRDGNGHRSFDERSRHLHEQHPCRYGNGQLQLRRYRHVRPCIGQHHLHNRA